MAPEDAPYLSAQAEAELRASEIEAAADRWYNATRDVLLGIWDLGRFLLFVVYALLAAVYFWLWAISALSFLLRLVLRLVMLPLLWLADGTPRRHGEKIGVPQALALDLRAKWAERDRSYTAMAKPLARMFLAAEASAIRFWHFSFGKKVLSLAVLFWLVFVPGLFIIPRPHYVQMINNDAIDYGGGGVTDVRYLVHAVDLFDPTTTREYMNEPAAVFGKVNAQGLKNRLHKGEYYKMWIVGIRWWYMPTLYPNILWVDEVDRQGNPIDDDSYMVPQESEPPAAVRPGN